MKPLLGDELARSQHNIPNPDFLVISLDPDRLINRKVGTASKNISGPVAAYEICSGTILGDLNRGVLGNGAWEKFRFHGRERDPCILKGHHQHLVLTLSLTEVGNPPDHRDAISRVFTDGGDLIGGELPGDGLEPYNPPFIKRLQIRRSILTGCCGNRKILSHARSNGHKDNREKKKGR